MFKLEHPRATKPQVHPTAEVSPSAQLGQGVVVGPGAIIYDNVIVGDRSFVGARVTLGEPLAGYYRDPGYENPITRLGPNSTIRSNTIIYAGCELGAEFQTGHNVVMREYSIFGDYCSYGSFSQTDGHLKVGHHSRFHSNVFLASFTEIEEFVCVYPFATTLDSPHPPCGLCRQGPTLKRHSVISAHATIMPRVVVGEGAVVGAKSLVAQDVPDGMFAVGVPAAIKGQAKDIECFTGDFAKAYPWAENFPDVLPWQRGRR
jgi:acetyltransferase-like isoleucine patch superfamily enzyme